MFDELFDVADIGDFADAESVVEIADFGDVADFGPEFYDATEFGTDIFEAPDFVGEEMTMFDDLSPDTGLFVTDGGYEVPWGDYAPSEPYYPDVYDTAIGPGLNGTPGFSPTATTDGGFFGGAKSLLQNVFSGNPNNAAQRTNTAYGRQTLYRNGGNVYAGPRQTTASGGLSNFARTLFGNGSAGTSRGGSLFSDGSGATSMFLIAGVGLLAVALLAKR